MRLKKQSAKKPDFNELNEMIQAIRSLLENKDIELTVEELCSFQGKDGSFCLLDSTNIPRDVIVGYIYLPTYLATAILMRDFLKGNQEIKDKLIKGLNFICKTGFKGHGYDAEDTRIEGLKILEFGGLAEFLEKEKQLCPRFHQVIHNILHEYNSCLITSNTFGPWGENYRKDWEELTKRLRPKKRLYLAYGSNMDKEQMSTGCPDAKLMGTTYLDDWELTLPFYLNLEPHNGKRIPVVVWEITAEDEKELDKYKGYPNCYCKKEFIITIDETTTTAMGYIMTNEYKKTDKLPREGYVEKVRQAYVDAGFDQNEFEPR